MAGDQDPHAAPISSAWRPTLKWTRPSFGDCTPQVANAGFWANTSNPITEWDTDRSRSFLTEQQCGVVSSATSTSLARLTVHPPPLAFIVVPTVGDRAHRRCRVRLPIARTDGAPPTGR